MDYGRDMPSNRLIDILDDDEKLNNLNEDYHYRQSVFPRLEKLRKLIWNEILHRNIPGITNDEQDKDLNFVQDLKSYLNTTPHRRITKSEMKKCNQLWRKYKNV
tara:strand:- start:15 stop:326 length:312 start_codon:yes stop_codon:yes gene_type:complete